MNTLQLGKWYAAQSLVRRLWAFWDSDRMRVIVTLEPTHDGDDVYPVWLARAHKWTSELQLLIDAPVELEVMDEPAGIDGVLVAELSWRDMAIETIDTGSDTFGTRRSGNVLP